MDPVLQAPFENGMAVSCPKRADPPEGWTLDFRAQPLQFSCGLDPSANVVHRIAASALTGWIQRRLGWYTVRAYSRRYATLCSISQHASSMRVEPISLPDLLMLLQLRDVRG